MNHTSWRVRGVVVALLVSAQAIGQDSNSSNRTEPDQVPVPAAASDTSAETGGQLAEQRKTPERPALRFPAGGFTGKDAFGLPPLEAPALKMQPQGEPRQEQVGNRAAQRRVGNRNFNRTQRYPWRVQPPVYLPNYNPNRPYGYPWGGYPWGGYPGYGYGYGYGYGSGVLLPGAGGGIPGGSNYFGNPHASQYLGNPHASQYFGNPHASQGQ